MTDKRPWANHLEIQYRSLIWTWGSATVWLLAAADMSTGRVDVVGAQGKPALAYLRADPDWPVLSEWLMFEGRC